MMYVRRDLDAMDPRYRVNFINSLSGFKSANLIGTACERGSTNVSVVSSAFHIGANPPLMGFIFRPDVAERHTLDNIRTTKQFTVNHIGADFVGAAHQTSARYPRAVSEFDVTGLTASFVGDFKAPRVGESRLCLGMELRQEIPLEINGTHMILAEIVWVEVDGSAIQEDGFVDLVSLNSVTVSGLDSYHRVEPGQRYPYAKP